MSAQALYQGLASRTKSLGILAAATVGTFLILDARLFEPEHNHIRQAVAAELRDPSSAQFQNIHGNGETYCGEVNARNGMGGYSGYRGFVSHRGIIFLEPHLLEGASIALQADHYEEVRRFARLQQKCER